MIPDGWKLVTEMATPEMVDAGRDGYSEGVANLRGIRSAYAAMLEAAPSPPPGWRGMDSAPKDGTEILVVSKHGYRHIATWSNAAGDEWVDDTGFTLAPVAWMPLPPPPEDRADG